MENFGHYLKSNRERQGIRLEEIASITKINLRTLELLEKEAWKKLPPEPFIRGFIVAYAKYVHLDIQEVLKKYLECTSQTVALPPTTSDALTEATLNTPLVELSEKVSPVTAAKQSKPSFERKEIPRLETFTQLTSKKWALGFTGALALLLVVFSLIRLGRNNRAPEVLVASEPAATITKVEPIAPAKVEAPTPQVQPPSNTELPAVTTETRTPAAAQVPESEFKHAIDVEGNNRSWMKVVIDDAAPQEFFLSEGQKINYKAKEKIKIVLGNSAGAKVLHNGEESSGKKLQGTIRFYIFPENARFPQDKIQKVSKNENAEKPAEKSESPSPDAAEAKKESSESTSSN